LSVADDLGFSQTQLKSIGMLVHALYNNPKVLYAPNNSAVNLIISKVRSDPFIWRFQLLSLYYWSLVCY